MRCPSDRLILPTCANHAIFSTLAAVENLRAEATEGRPVRRTLIGSMAIGVAVAIFAGAPV